MEIDIKISDEFRDLTSEHVEFHKKCSKLALDVTQKRLTIGQLVEELGPFLVDISPENRSLGIWVLSKVLEGLPVDFLDSKQLSFICTFYADRFKDNHQVIPAVLTGTLALVKFENFPKGAVRQIFSAFFQNIACQQQQQKDREVIYQLFEVLLTKRKEEVCEMGLEFVYGVISAVDGERDPKNLIIVFDFFPKFLKNVELKHLTEEAFEVLACYFPVDFKAPPQDPHAITREALAGALAFCLCCIPQFAEPCITLALEKLDSSLEVAQLDSLKLLEQGCQTFDTSSYAQHSSEIFSQIQKLLLSKPNQTIESSCFSTLSAVTSKISLNANLVSSLKDISDTVKGNLMPDSKLFHYSSTLLLCLASASQPSSNYLTREIAPLLINLFNITSTPFHKVTILKTLMKFYKAYCDLHESVEFEELTVVPFLCVRASLDENDNLRRVGFESLTLINKTLPLDVRLSVYEKLKIILVNPRDVQTREAALNLFEKLSENFPTEVEGLIGEIKKDNLKFFLEALCRIAGQDHFRKFVVQNLACCLRKNGEITVNCLVGLMKRFEGDEEMQEALFGVDMIEQLIDWGLNQPHVDESLSLVLKSMVGFQSTERQNEIISKVLPKCRNSVLLDGVLSRIRRDVQFRGDEVLEELTKEAVAEGNLFKDVSAQLIANLINKSQNEFLIDNYLKEMEKRFNHNNESLALTAWIIKALVMRNHHLADYWTNKLVEALDCNINVAPYFGVILNDNIDRLSSKSFCVQTLLYRQKFFNAVTNKLNERYCPENITYLAAIGYLLEHAPRQAILLQFKKILKLIILCFEKCEEPNVLLVLLQMIKDFITQKESCIEDNLQDFVVRLLKLATFENAMEVRRLALQCLQQVSCTYPVYKLLPFKQDVLKVLGKCVDDKKRLVRKEAVEARSSWFMIDAPV